MLVSNIIFSSNGFSLDVKAFLVIPNVKGGIKAVVWTDVVQGALMIGSVALVCVLGTIKVGGVGEVLNIASKGSRLDVRYDLIMY